MKTTGSISSFVFALVIASACAQSAPEPFFEGLGSGFGEQRNRKPA
jgi:hypothetical protein